MIRIIPLKQLRIFRARKESDRDWTSWRPNPIENSLELLKTSLECKKLLQQAGSELQYYRRG